LVDWKDWKKALDDNKFIAAILMDLGIPVQLFNFSGKTELSIDLFTRIL
jgi:hypothetical protein